MPIMRAWVAGARESTQVVPRAHGTPQVHADGVNADRVLVIGSGAVVGFGVLTYDLSISGRFARSLAQRTGRGVDVDIVARTGMTTASALRRLEALPLWRYDAIVVALGLNEALDLTSPDRWGRDLTAVLEFLDEHKSGGAQIAVLGTPPIASLPGPQGPLAAIARRQSKKLDEVTAALCANRPHTRFISLNEPVMRRQRDVPNGEEYRLAGDTIASIMAPAVDKAHEHPDRLARRVHGFDNEDARQAAVDALGELDTEALERVVDLARELFGTANAILSVVDGEESRHVVHLGVPHESVPRVQSFCGVTIQNRGAMIIPDATKDSRFSDNPFVKGEPKIRFYAGHPVEGANGEPIGTLCVFDPSPRDAISVDEVLLRALALQVQELLRLPAAGVGTRV